ncbi:MAG: permease-like cell division protein FtsX [Candidatus Marinimicrobia bacterium]|nr:permease-like cell division protein FtsX [Candidatus Neomarinimicrobiota bacterium]
MKLNYIIREGIVGIRRSTMAFMNSVFSVTIALVLVAVGVLFVDNGLEFIGQLQADYDLEIFLENEADAGIKQELATIISEYPGIFRMDYLSKEDAAALYNAEFGEDVLSLLDDNPLPSSFRVTFEETYRSTNYIQAFINSMEALPMVDEIMFKRDLFDRVQGIMKSIYVVAAAAIFLIILSTVFLTSNNLRLMILSRYDFIETVRLLGASDFMVKAPFFLEGGLLGFIGGVFAILIISGFEFALKYFHIIDLPSRIMNHPELMIGTLLFGIALSSLGMLKTVRRMLRFVA